MINTVIGKVFVRPATKAEYGPIRVPSTPTIFSTLNGTSFDVVAEDVCGNCFTMMQDGAVWFWDHETDELIRLADSVAEFISHYVDSQPVHLSPKQVKSVWIDPAFAKSIGKKCHRMVGSRSHRRKNSRQASCPWLINPLCLFVKMSDLS